MILEKGNMWDVFGSTDLFLITTNPIINKQGLAVMGRGIALEASKRFPYIRKDFAKRMQQLKNHGPLTVNIIKPYYGQMIGFFMVKDHWAEDAKLSLIEKSVEELCDKLTPRGQRFCSTKYLHDVRVDLNFPGIGNGKLKREDVLPLIEKLPDNVHVWEYE